MTTYNTGNPLGSADPRDLYDNAENLDNAVNSTDDTWTDRFGVYRKTFTAMAEEFDADQTDREARFNALIAASGYQYIGDYAAGITVTEYNQVIRDGSAFWRLAPSESLPYTTTGSGMPEGGAFVYAGDATIRQELATDSGAGLIGTTDGETVQQNLGRRVRSVSTVSEIEALTPSAGQQVSLSGTRCGLFRFNESDLSANVAIDPMQGIYIAPSSDPTGASGAWVRDMGNSSWNPLWWEITKDESSASNTARMISMLAVADLLGGAEIVFESGDDTYNFDCSSEAIDLPSNVTLDLGGNTLHRTDAVNRRFIGNTGRTSFRNNRIKIKNGNITGIGADGVTTDQGAGIGLWNVEDMEIDSITTDATTGDGMSFRSCDGVVKNCRIKRFGRNAISPTSGNILFENVRTPVDGEDGPFSGANPGLYIDCENNDPDAEITKLTFDRVRTGGVVLVDLITSTDYSKFVQSATFTNCTLGPSNFPLRIASTAITIDADVECGPSNIVLAGDLRAISIERVGGATISPRIGVADGFEPTGNWPVIRTLGEVNGLNVINPVVQYDNPNGDTRLINCDTGSIINDALIRADEIDAILIEGSNNRFISQSINKLLLRGSASSGNSFSYKEISTIGLLDSADLSLQEFGAGYRILAKSFYSYEEEVSSFPHQFTVNLPDAVGSGRVSTVILGYSHNGDSGHWAAAQFAIRHGDNASATAYSVYSESGVSISGFSVVSASIDSVTVQIDAQYPGTVTATVV